MSQYDFTGISPANIPLLRNFILRGHSFKPLNSAAFANFRKRVPSSGPGTKPKQKPQTEVERRLAALLGPQEADIKRRGAADAEALAAASAAASAILKEIAPNTANAYRGAAQDVSGFASGFTGDMAARLRAAQDQNAAFAASQGGSTSGGANVGDAQNALFAEGGYNPASSLEAQGASAAAYANQLPGIQAVQGNEDVRQRMQQTDQELVDLAAKTPELRQQIEDELWKREMDKANLRLQQQQVEIQNRAQSLYEKQFGETARHHAVTEAQTTAGLKLKYAKQQADLDQAKADGKKPNASLSRAYGYIVDDYGNPILDSKGNRIKVADKSSSKDKKNRANLDYNKAVGEAKTIRGTPQLNPNPAPSGPKSGKYVTANGGTTNDPKKAATDSQYSFVSARNYLMQRYNLTRAQARKALIAAGWIPDGQRPPPGRSNQR